MTDHKDLDVSDNNKGDEKLLCEQLTMIKSCNWHVTIRIL